MYKTQARGGGRSVTSLVELTFPASKSWVEATWRVADPEGVVASCGLDLDLSLEGSPILVDLGARSTVYGALKGGEWMELAAGVVRGSPPGPAPDWVVRKGPRDQGELLAIASAEYPGRAEGWAHVMDARRATALAVAGFGRSTADRIAVGPTGQVRITRHFVMGEEAPPKGEKTITCWFHFVPMPVQVGAATSPQAMLEPLRVVWI
ncbi:MAG: hypothetical protein IRY99_19490 [Isosphaeraceae bacterium]|nr:hypothetical protein [Isosphaeraceae bacterium]